MTDGPQGEDWWQASDFRWYPPQTKPGNLPLPPPSAASVSGAAHTPNPSQIYKLNDTERNRILDRAVESRRLPLITGTVNGWLRVHQPRIQVDRASVSAVVVWGKYFDSPGIVALLAVLSFVTCGLFLPVWLLYLLRRNRFAEKVSIDDYGIQHWSVAPIPLRQRVVTIVVLIGVVWWIIHLLNMWQSIKMGTY